MEIRIADAAPQEVRTPVFIAGIFQDETPLETGLGRLDAALGNRIELAVKHEDFTGKRGETLNLYAGLDEGPRHVVIVGLGKREEWTPEIARRAFGEGGKQARGRKVSEIAVMPPLKNLGEEDARRITRAALEGAALAMYRYVRQTKDLDKRPLLETLVAVPGEDHDKAGFGAGVNEARATLDGASFARDLASMPGGDLYPESFAEIAKTLASDAIKVEIFDRAKLEELGMGALLGVGRGSSHPPVLIHLSYNPSDLPKNARTFCIVGKGITFDTGGMNLKPSDGIRDMKIDMAGSAAVMGVFKALEAWKPGCRVEGFIPAAENKTGSDAYLPGDVLTGYKGLTIEIDNTDAEGRLALSDALAYAEETVKPDAIVDLATLTGACMIALGHHATGLMGTSDELAELLSKAGEETGERVWRLPLWDDYDEQIKSEIADLKNTGGRPGGAITAGWFLRHFIEETPWIHLDIAGTASEVPVSYVPHKELPTGVGVRLLLEALRQWA